jgi:hypothetical protein
MPAKVRRISGLASSTLARVAGQQPVLVALLLLGSLTSCARKAPGPEECVRFAESWFDVERERALRNRDLSAHFEQKVHDCLTTPYDRELVECVTAGGDNRRCARSYEQRHVARKRDDG